MFGKTIHEAAASGDVLRLRELSNSWGGLFFSINEKDKNGWTALHHASWHGQYETIKWLFENFGKNSSAKEKLEVNAKTLNGTTALHLVNTHSYMDGRYDKLEDLKQIIRYLVQVVGVDISICDQVGRTALDHVWNNKRLREFFIETFNADEHCLEENKDYLQFHAALNRRDIETAREIFKRRPQLDLLDKDDQKFTSLHRAASEGNFTKFKFITELLNYSDKELSELVDKNKKNIMHYLISAISNLSNNSEHKELLFYITKEKNCKLATCVDEVGNTPINSAVSYCSLEVIQHLIEHEPESINIKGNKNRTLLHSAIERRRPIDIIEYLTIKDKSALLTKDQWGDTPLHLLLEAYCKAYIKNENENSYFNKIFSFFISYGADPGIENNNKNTPFDIVLSEFEVRKYSHLKTIEELEYIGQTFSYLGKEIKYQFFLEFVKTMMIIMISKRNIDIYLEKFTALLFSFIYMRKITLNEIKFMLELGLSVNTREDSTSNMTLLHVATLLGNKDIVRFLIADVHADTAICAFLGNNLNYKKYATILPPGCRLGERETVIISGSPLHFAIWQSNTAMVALLVNELQVSVNTVDQYGNTPLHIAVALELTDIIFILMNNVNINVTLKNDKGLTAVEGTENSVLRSYINLLIESIKNKTIESSAGEVRLDKKIGEGGYGIVYKGIWNNMTVAIKKIKFKNNQFASTNSFEKFQREADLMSTLHHTNIVHFHTMITDVNNCFIIMDYIDGGSLFQALQNKDALIAQYQCEIIEGMAEGLNYLHIQKTLHGDVKSSNVLLDKNYQPKFCDFGLSEISIGTYTTNFQAGMARGTPQWMAPELFQSDATCTNKTDVWSFGVVVWEIVTGNIPFQDKLGIFEIQKHLQESVQPLDVPDTCPKGLAELMAMCWMKNPKERPNMKKVTSFFAQNRKAPETVSLKTNEIPQAPEISSYNI